MRRRVKFIMHKFDERRLIKSEHIDLNADYIELFAALKDKPKVMDERVIKKMGKELGFQTTDEKVHKLVSLHAEAFLDEVLTSINHKNKKEIEAVFRKFKEAEDDDSELSRDAEEEVPEPAQEPDGRARALAAGRGRRVQGARLLREQDN